MTSYEVLSVNIRPTPIRRFPKKTWWQGSPGWKLLRDTPVIDKEIISSPLEIVSFMKSGEGNYDVYGATVISRASDLRCHWGQRHAEALLENQALIPEEAKEYQLLFPHTIWFSVAGHLTEHKLMTSLIWCTDGWAVEFIESDNYHGKGNFGSHQRLLRPKAQTTKSAVSQAGEVAEGTAILMGYTDLAAAIDAGVVNTPEWNQMQERFMTLLSRQSSR
jgi:hypothetical protein